jgi:MATE family multidrug resistance protein
MRALVPTPALRAEIVATTALAWPMALTNLIQLGMTTTDVMFLGRLGPKALAASALGLNLFYPFFMFAVGFMSAIAPMIARERGAKPHSVREVRRTARQGFWAAAIISAPALLILWRGESVLLAFGQAPELAAQAGAYLRALMWSLPAFMLYQALRSFVTALERPSAGLIAVIVAFLANALFNWMFVFGRLGAPALGLVGSGIATTLAAFTLVATLALFGMFDRRLRRYHVFGRFWRADLPRLRALAALGVPIGLTVLFESSVFNAAVFLMGLIGEASLAAHMLAIQLASLTFMMPVGVAQAASVRVGLFLGARDWPSLRRAGWTALALGVGVMALAALAMIFAPRLLISAFIDVAAPANAEVVRLAVIFLAVAAAFQLFDGAQAVGAGMLRGLHDTRWPMLYALFGYWVVGLPLGALLAFVMGWNGVGIWTGLAVALALVSWLMIARWRKLIRSQDALEGKSAS